MIRDMCIMQVRCSMRFYILVCDYTLYKLVIALSYAICHMVYVVCYMFFHYLL